MTELQAPEEEAEWLRLTKPQNDVHARVASPMPLSSLADLPANSCLFALSNVWGLVFVGDESSIKIHSLPTINTIITNPKPPTSDLSPHSDPLQKIDLSARPVWIRLAMGDTRLVVGTSDGVIEIWDVKKVLQGELSPIHSFPSFRVPLSNLLPNPSLVGGLPHLVLALGPEKVDILSIKDGEFGVVGGLEGSYTCVAWSVKGKQFVAGRPDGLLEQYAPDCAKKAEIPPPPSLIATGQTYQPTSVAWLENDLFLVTYGPSPPDPELKPKQYIISRQPKATPPSFIYTEIDEYFLSGFNDRAGTYRELALIKNWGTSKHLAFVIAQCTPEVGILQCRQSSGEWAQLDLDENARAALPFQELGPESSEEVEEAVPLGVEIDLTPTEPIKRPMEGGLPVPDLPPMPRLLVYSSDGVIVSYDIRNTEAGAFDGMIVPKDIITAETASTEDTMQTGTETTTSTIAKPAAPVPSVPAVLPFGATATGVKPSFGFGGTKKLPSLGGGFGGGGGFGSVTTPTFGSSGFGAPSAFGASGFGAASGSASASASSSAVPAAFGGTATSASAFGGAGTSVSAFGGSPASASAFGGSAPKPASAFGSTASGAFGSASGGAFASSATETPKPNPFATAAASGFGSTTPPTGAFGQSKPSGAFGASPFGQQPAFGGLVSSTALFGGQSTTAPKPATTSPIGAFASRPAATTSTFGFAKPAPAPQTNLFAPLQSKPSGSAFGGMDMLGDMLSGDDASVKAAEPASPESVAAERAGSESPTKPERAVQPLFRQPGLFSGGSAAFGGSSAGPFGQGAPLVPKPADTSKSGLPVTKASPFGSSGFGQPAAATSSTPVFGTSGFGSAPAKPATVATPTAGGGFGGFSKGGFSGFASPASTPSTFGFGPASPASNTATKPTVPSTSAFPGTSHVKSPKAEDQSDDQQETSSSAAASTATELERPPNPAGPPSISEASRSPIADQDDAASSSEAGLPPAEAEEEEALSSPDKLASSGTGSQFSSSAEESRESEDELGDEEAEEQVEAQGADVAPAPKAAPQAFTGWGDKPSAQRTLPGAKKWECPTCAVSWPDQTEVCGACETRRPGTQAPPAPANPFASFGMGPSSVAGPSSTPLAKGFGFAPLPPPSQPICQSQPQSKSLGLGFRMPSSTPAVRSPLAMDVTAYPPSPSPFQKEASTSNFFSMAPLSRATTPMPLPTEQSITPKKPRDQYDFAREEIGEQGIAGQFARIYQDLQQELDTLHTFTVKQNDRHRNIRDGPHGDRVSVDDIAAASQWPFGQLDLLREHGHALEILASEAREEATELDDQLDGLLDTFYKVQLQLAECERLTKAKVNPGVTRRLRVRKLGPVQEREQAMLRALNKELVDKMDEGETALARLRKRIAHQRTGQSPVRNNAWHTTQAAIRDTTARIREQQLNIDDLVARVGRVDMEPSEPSGSKRASFSETESEPYEGEKPVRSDARVSAALNGEAFGALLVASVPHSTARIVKCQRGTPAARIDSKGRIISEANKTTTPRTRTIQSQPSPLPAAGGGFGFGIGPASTIGLKGLGLGKAPSRTPGRNTLHLQGARASPSEQVTVPSTALNFFSSGR